MGNVLSWITRTDNVKAEREKPATLVVSEIDIGEEKIANQVCFGAGCYWGTEKYYRTEFNKLYPGAVIDGKVGFMGPPTAVKNPSYREVCSGATGHVEVYRLQFDGSPEMFERMVLYFFQFHDPTTLNRQGNDSGPQYASFIFCYDDAQVTIARHVMAKVQQWLTEGKINKNAYAGSVLTTEIRHVRDCTEFYPAHAEHQRYLEENPQGYCNHRIRIRDWPRTELAKEQEKEKEKLEQQQVLARAAQSTH